ncbi:GCFC domain containing hypothetical protein [Phytophthora palmivora]|uniref:GCF C-terminal domain-containing protein n=1 Tax=Phytophthora palmivora TaxID=4796 RepID=A0A2P4X3T9_9STRA|nr:GCFC domain containing hypothetical protein [Phytophthora palmivora]
MFRSKRKKVGGRKRREVELDDETSESAENDLQVLETLRRSRTRPKSAMTFVSKSTRANGGTNESVTVETNGLLSFDDGESRKQKKRKMRPNLVASSAGDEETETSGQYSAEMLASLRSEQSVLLSQRKVLEVEEGNDEEVKKIVEEEEFIALEEDETIRVKSHVTFEEHIDKAAEVVELSAEEEENKEWEEELMRRGGHRVKPPSDAHGRRARDGLPTYPTRRKVACVSLGSVLGKLEKSVESIAFEDERASRELARLGAETALIEATLKKQHQELLTSSEEFEYFQEVEDFVKGLSFCLREKIPKIDAKEKKIINDRAQRVKANLQKEQHDVIQTIEFYLNSGILQRIDVIGPNELDLHSNEAVSADDTQLAPRKYQDHFPESYVADTHHVDEDLFADAIDEINSIERVYGRFQEWKAKFPEVYENVYCELAQEKLFAPYVQAELLCWDPLSVADVNTLGKSWSLADFTWFRILNQHLRKTANGGVVDHLILYQIRDVLLEKVRAAVSSYFDPYSSLQARSLSLVLEEINRYNFSPHVEGSVQILVNIALEAFSSEAKRAVLVAINQCTAESCEGFNTFANYLLERFNALQDNLLTFFVALPKGKIASGGFRCLLQVLHQLLTYIQYCQETKKTQLITTATQVVRQLAGSSYLLQILSEPSQERDLKRVMEQFTPFLQNIAQ